MTLLNTLQQSVYQCLSTDETLMSLVNGVYDRAIQDTAFPYVCIGEASSADWSTKTTLGADVQMTIDIWSRQGGRKETIAIIERISSLLNDAALELSGYSLVMLRLSSSQVSLEKDGWTYHGSMKFRALLEKE